jgi:hypothetical protein
MIVLIRRERVKHVKEELTEAKEAQSKHPWSNKAMGGPRTL